MHWCKKMLFIKAHLRHARIKKGHVAMTSETPFSTKKTYLTIIMKVKKT